MELKNWNKEKYNEFIKYLYSLEDLRYKKFHNSLTKDNNLIGIRTPILKEIAKEISKNDYEEFFKYNKFNTYEEKIIYGLVIGYVKVDFKTVLIYLDLFTKHISNWAVCDIVCSNLKCFNKNKDIGLNYIKKLIKCNETFKVRFGLVLLLNYYINKENLSIIFDIIDNLNNDEYYVKMASAWLLSICYIKYKKETTDYLKNNKLTDWTYNKTISKICDSKRVDSKTKIELKNGENSY